MVEKIYELYCEINDIYGTLFRLELDGDINSEIYIMVENNLKKKIKKEREIVLKFFKSHMDLYYDVLCMKIKMPKAEGQRLLSFANMSMVKINHYDSEEEKRLDRFYDLCTTEIHLLYLSFLQEAINYYPQYREDLLKLKYISAYSNHYVEEGLISNNFLVSRDNDIYLDCYADILKLDKEKSMSTTKYCSLNIINAAIDKILEVKDCEYSDESCRAYIINFQCIMRGCLTILNNSGYEYVKGEVMKRISEKKQSINDYTISLKIIEDIICDGNKYKSRIRKVSLKPDNV